MFDVTSRRDSFFLGFVRGITSEIIKSEERGLIIYKDDALKPFIKSEVGDKIKTKPTTYRLGDDSAMRAGYNSGVYTAQQKRAIV